MGWEISRSLLIFKNKPGALLTEPPGAPDLPKFPLVDIYMSCTEKQEIIRTFTSETSVHIVATTVAFGMSIDCPSVHQVILLGAPGDLESYVQVQETQNAGHDGLASCKIAK